MMLTVNGLCTDYVGERGQAIRAANDVSFEVPQGKLFTLLGPSGCGKTTTLRSIAGLERPLVGEISVGGDVVYSSARGVFIPPNQRGLGMVFQSYAIWPHMTVFENAAFPMEPRLLLLDEPLSNLDAKLRERMRFELKRLQRELGITTVYVTHDQSEALALSHSIAVMNRGRIEQIGAPREIYERPVNQFVADFIGSTNFIDATVSGVDGAAGFYRVRCELGELKAFAHESLTPADKVVLSVRPEDIHLSESRPEGENVWEGTVDQKVFLGEFADWQVAVGERRLQSRVHPSLRTKSGERIYVRIDPEKCVALKP